MVNNVRTNHRGRDLNRDFQNNRIEFVREWKKVLADRHFDLALNLHEDYDAQGAYVYELAQKPPYRAEGVLDSLRPIIPPDSRSRIDTSWACNGVIRRKFTLADFDDFGLPEAIFLHFHHSGSTLTIETPSEFSLFYRILAHSTAISHCIGTV